MSASSARAVSIMIGMSRVAASRRKCADQFEPAHVRQHPVDQDQVRAPVADARKRRLAVLRERDVAAGTPQPERDQVADRLLILDDKYSGVRHAQAIRLTAHC